MPQMAPMNWLSLYFLFITLYIIFLTMNYFSQTNKIYIIKQELSKNKTTWKW
uniref:ATP synthase complex subunit 8 n=1 Tax=Pseudocolaspis sp. PSE01 TaxID=1205646 RepID=A0A0S2MP21_9CUCU|nr:ATP synthase F0 subunit 8 [Pseudocolaspis sp. PSE01]